MQKVNNEKVNAKSCIFDHEALEFKRGSWGREKQGKEVRGGKNERGKKNLRLQTVPFIAKQSHSLQK